MPIAEPPNADSTKLVVVPRYGHRFFSLRARRARRRVVLLWCASPPRPSLSIQPPPAQKNFFFVIAGIYFTLFGSSIKVLLHKRKTISGAVPLLVLAGVLGVLITWVSMTTLYVQLVC